MKQISKRLLGALLAIIMVVSMAPVGALTASATNASTQSTITTGSIITYGSYPQTKVTDSALITNLNAQTLQGDNTVTYGNSKYKRVYFTQYTPNYTTGTPDASHSYQDDNGYYINTVYWFKFEPLQWRVLSNTNGELFVMADKILDSKAYNQAQTNVTWENCTMRTWLNGDFYNTAFSSTERSKIKTSTVINANNPWYGTAGGNNTSDKLFLLSYAETMNPSYGFSSSTGSDTARIAQGTDFSKSNGLYVYNSNPYLGNSYWWLRSPGGGPSSAGIVLDDGIVLSGDGSNVYYASLGARPAFKLNLTSDIFTSKVGSNCMINGLNNFIYGLDPGITSLDDYVDVAQGYELECIPSTAGFGTGTLVNVKLGEETVESYTIIIYGDVNGDGNIDSTDAGLTVDYENYIISWDPVADAATIKAGDLNGDGIIDSIDAGITVDTENHISFINQLTGIRQ